MFIIGIILSFKRLQEKHIKKKQIDYYAKLAEYQKKFRDTSAKVSYSFKSIAFFFFFLISQYVFRAKLTERQEKIKELSCKYEKIKILVESSVEIDFVDRFNYDSALRDLKAACLVS